MKESQPVNYCQELEYIICGQLTQWTSPVFIDVGAEKGSFSRYMLESGFTEGYAFEPLPRHYENLVASLKGTKMRIFDYALDDRERVAEFHIATTPSGEEADYYHSLNRLEGDKVVLHSKKIHVKCKTLQQLVKEGHIPKEIGLLKLDTEGNDLNVIKGLGAIRPKVIMCEFFMPGLYNGWGDASPNKIVPYLEKMGYGNFLAIKRNHLYESLELNPIAYAKNTWGNLIFFSQEIFENSRNWIENHLIASENRRIEHIDKLQNELEAKEAVIQELLRKAGGKKR